MNVLAADRILILLFCACGREPALNAPAPPVASLVPTPATVVVDAEAPITNRDDGGEHGLAWLDGDVLRTAEPIRFSINRAEILPSSWPVLRSVAGVLEAHPSLRIRVEVVGTAAERDRGFKLSLARGTSVRAFLVDQGIAESRVQVAESIDDDAKLPSTTFRVQ